MNENWKIYEDAILNKKIRFASNVKNTNNNKLVKMQTSNTQKYNNIYLTLHELFYFLKILNKEIFSFIDVSNINYSSYEIPLRKFMFLNIYCSKKFQTHLIYHLKKRLKKIKSLYKNLPEQKLYWDIKIEDDMLLYKQLKIENQIKTKNKPVTSNYLSVDFKNFIDALKELSSICSASEAFEILAPEDESFLFSIKLNTPDNMLDFPNVCNILDDPLEPLISNLDYILNILLRENELWKQIKFK